MTQNDNIAISDFFSENPAEELIGDCLFNSRAWLTVLRKSYGFNFFLAKHKASNVGICFALIENLLGKKLVSLPFSDYSGMNQENRDQYQEILQAIKVQFQDLPFYSKVQGDSSEANQKVWGNKVKTGYRHTIGISSVGNPRESMSNTFKRNVRNAKNNEIKICIKKDQKALETFYEMYHQLRMRKFRSIPQPYGFFQHVFDEFIARDLGFILEAKHADNVIASIIVLNHKKVLYYKFGTSKQSTLSLKPNNLLFNTLINYAYENGYEEIDLGYSGSGSNYEGLTRFKESMGGVPSDISVFKLGPQAHENQKNLEAAFWIDALVDRIVSQNLNAQTTSKLSEIIYPLFA